MVRLNLVVLGGWFFAALCSSAFAESLVGAQGTVEVGVGYDSNPGHIERVAGDESIVGAPLLLLQGQGALSWRPGARHHVFLSWNGAAKQFATSAGRRENAMQQRVC